MKLDCLHDDGTILVVLRDTRDRLVGHGFDNPHLARVWLQRYYSVYLFVYKRLLDRCVPGQRIYIDLALVENRQLLGHRLK